MASPNSATLSAKPGKTVSDVYAEHDFAPPKNQLLDRYFETHSHATKGEIDLTSSFTKLPPPADAIRAAADAAAQKDNELNSCSIDLIVEAQKYGERGSFLENTIADLSTLKKDAQESTPVATFKNTLDRIMSENDPDNIKKAVEKLSLNADVKKYALEYAQGNTNVSLPVNSPDEKSIKQSVIDLTIELCKQELIGTNDKPGVKKKFAELQGKIEEANAAAPNAEQLAEQTKEIKDKMLKPAVVKLMHCMQGMDSKSVKPDNIYLCTGSSMAITNTALQTLIKKSSTSSWQDQTQKKKVLIFSLSWSGLKGFAKNNIMEPSQINGPVSAEALEDHIKNNILGGKFADDLPAAQAEVRRQIGALVMNIPENPLGKIPTAEETEALAKVIKKYDIPLVIIDEIFASPGYKSLSSYPGMGERCYTTSSTSKNLNLDTSSINQDTPRLGYGYSANDDFAHAVSTELNKRNAEIHPTHAVAFGTLIEQIPESYYVENQQELARKRHLINDTMKRVNKEVGMENAISWASEPNYGSLGVISMPRELTDQCNIPNNAELSEYIYKVSGIMTTPIGDTSTDEKPRLGVRINFSGDDRELVEAIERIGVAVEHMKAKKQYQDVEGDKYRGAPVNRYDTSNAKTLDQDLQRFAKIIHAVDERGV